MITHLQTVACSGYHGQKYLQGGTSNSEGCSSNYNMFRKKVNRKTLREFCSQGLLDTSALGRGVCLNYRGFYHMYKQLYAHGFRHLLCFIFSPSQYMQIFFFIVKIQRDYSSMTSINIYQITNSFLVTVYEVDIASKRRGKHVRNTDTYTFLFVSCCKQNLKSYDNVKKIYSHIQTHTLFPFCSA